MQPHQQRVVDELKELQGRLEKLHNFISSDNFDEIVNDEYECQRLIYQRHCMQQYAFTLQDRIANFK
jgi:hypothetical protein